jgi:hypothetical protein
MAPKKTTPVSAWATATAQVIGDALDQARGLVAVGDSAAAAQKKVTPALGKLTRDELDGRLNYLYRPLALPPAPFWRAEARLDLGFSDGTCTGQVRVTWAEAESDVDLDELLGLVEAMRLRWEPAFGAAAAAGRKNPSYPRWAFAGAQGWKASASGGDYMNTLMFDFTVERG